MVFFFLGLSSAYLSLSLYFPFSLFLSFIVLYDFESANAFWKTPFKYQDTKIKKSQYSSKQSPQSSKSKANVHVTTPLRIKR